MSVMPKDAKNLPGMPDREEVLSELTQVSLEMANLCAFLRQGKYMNEAAVAATRKGIAFCRAKLEKINENMGSDTGSGEGLSGRP